MTSIIGKKERDNLLKERELRDWEKGERGEGRQWMKN